MSSIRDLYRVTALNGLKKIIASIMRQAQALDIYAYKAEELMFTEESSEQDHIYKTLSYTP